jgi:hypothetical protein
MRTSFLSLVAALAILSSAAPLQATALHSVAVVASQQDFQFGVSVGQSDVAYYQGMLWDGTITRDQYDEAIYAMRQSALEHEAAATTESDRDYYRGYYEGLAFA